ncbi:uncharacterized protein LOC127794594 isoform X1 [Diospyros lotus]|uniref:uncharacterized protein LOC127794594 isoform X1 n=1 Tax=Diospyros lotus TaxID=55363 RepID=UPI0022595B0C|nr:uncharacterized protein LOC127794594 isoform X1 [Diospyros lotus]
MGSETTKSGNGGKGGGFRGRMEHFLYSGDKKHVWAGIAIISAIFAVPWYLMNRGCWKQRGIWKQSFERHLRVKEQNTNPIKITWKELTKRGVKDFLLFRLQPNDRWKIFM